MKIKFIRPSMSIDEMVGLESKNICEVVGGESDAKRVSPQMVKFILGGAVIASIVSPVPFGERVKYVNPCYSHERIESITNSSANIFNNIVEDVNFVCLINRSDLDKLVDGDEIKDEIDIISGYMKNSKSIYEYCKEEFTI